MPNDRRDAVLNGDSPPRPSPRRLSLERLCTFLYHFLRIGLGCLFVYAGLVKLLDPKAFAHSLAQFELLPDPLLPIVAVGLPALELLAGLGLVFQVRGSLTVTLLLLGLFVLVLGYAVLLDLDIDCGCFTVAEITARTGVRQALGRDLLLVAATLFLRRRWRQRDEKSEKSAN